MTNAPHTSTLLSVNPQLAWGIIATACILVIFATFGIGIAVFALLGILICWWVFEYPEESFLTLVILSPLLPLLKATQTLGNATLIKDVIIITLFLRNFAFPLLTQRLQYRRNALFAPIIALVAWAVFAVLRSGITTLSILRLRDIVLYILLYFGVLFLPHTAKRMKIRVIVFLTTLIITILLGVFQFLHLPDSTVLRFDPAREIWIPRVASTFAHPTVFAEYLITGAMVIIGITIGTRLKNTAGKWPCIAGLSIAFLAICMLLYLTYTRAGWIGFVAGIGAIGVVILTAHSNPLQLPLEKGGGTRRLLPFSRGGWVGCFFGICAISLMFFSLYRFTPVGTFIRSGFDLNYGSNAERIVFIVQLISQTSNTDAVIGKGLGNTITKMREGGDATAFDIASGESRTIQLSKDQTLVDNQYLKTFIEMGVVGLVLTMWLFWRFYLSAKNAVASKDSISRVIGITCIGFLAAFIVQALFVDIWDVYPTNAIFWTLAALVSQQRDR